MPIETIEDAVAFLVSAGITVSQTGNQFFVTTDSGIVEMTGEELLAQVKASVSPTEQPEWWDEARDGKFPAEWDNARLGEFPRLVTGKDEFLNPILGGADWAAARKRIQDVGVISPLPAEEVADEEPGEAEIVNIGGREFLKQPNGTLKELDPKEAQPFQGFESREAAQADPSFGPGDEVFRDPGSNRFFIRESRPQPTLSTDEQIDALLAQWLDTGDNTFLEQAQRLDVVRDQINSRRLTPEDIFNIVAPIAQNPEHFRQLRNSLLEEMGQQFPVSRIEAARAQEPPTTVVTGRQELPALTTQDRQVSLTGGRTMFQREAPPVVSPAEEEELPGGGIPGQDRTIIPGADTPLFSQRRVAATGRARTEEEEAELDRLIGTAEFATERGVTGTPRAAATRIRELQSFTQFGPTTQVRNPLEGNDTRGEQNRINRFVRDRDAGRIRAFGGTRFFPIRQGDIQLERFTRRFNEAQQRRFIRQGRRQVQFSR